MGLGNSNFGSGPYGYGTPQGAPTRPGQIFSDPSTGTVGTGRKIDPGTRQYVFGDDGRISGQDSVPQRVYLAYATVKGSSIMPELGETFSEVQTIGDDFVEQMTQRAKEPVQAMIDAKELEIVSVSIDRFGPSGASIEVRWVDLTTGREGATTL